MRTKTLRRIAPTEADTLKAITDYLEVSRVLYIRINPISPVNSGKGLRFRAVRPSQLGAPDLIVFWAMKVHGMGWTLTPLAIEVKSLVGMQSPAQTDWELRAAQAGLNYRVVRTLEEFQEALADTEIHAPRR